MRIVAFALLAGLTTAASAAPIGLGLDDGMNAVFFNDFTVPSSDVQGRLAVGGDATISSYSINTVNGSSALSNAGPGLVVGGDLTFTSGSIWGDVIVGGDANVNSTGSISGGTLTSGVGDDMPFHFSAEEARLKSLSDQLAALGTTGTMDMSWCLNLHGSGTALEVFNLTAAQATSSLCLDGIDPLATVVINIAGENVHVTNHYYGGFNAGQVLFNFAEALTLNMEGAITASLLAPNGNIYSPYGGVIDGQVVASSWSGSMQINQVAFRGNLPEGQTTKVPEPATAALMLFGLAALYRQRRR